MTFDQTKFDDMVDHILDEHGPLNKEKLSWILFDIDFTAFGHLGEPITGARYIKREVYPEIQDDDGNVVSFDRWVEA